MNELTLSIVIPAYNEALRIGATLRSIERFFEDKTDTFSYEIIVVDDGSTDGTFDLIRSYADRIPQLHILENGTNKGKGHAVHRGMLQSKGSYRLYMDADNSVDISHLNVFIHHVQAGYDVVIGSIKIRGASIVEQGVWYRRILGDLSKALIRICAVPEIYDTQRGFKLFSAEAADVIFPKQTIEGFGFDIEVLTIARVGGLKIKELPVVWINPAGSKVTLGSYFETLRELIYIIRNRLMGQYKGQ